MHKSKKISKSIEKRPRPKKITALAFDRDKNLIYLANDESVDEILDSEGYHVVHANRDLENENKK